MESKRKKYQENHQNLNKKPLGNYKKNPRHKKDSKLRYGLTEKQVDKMIEDTFPASDPPSTY